MYINDVHIVCYIIFGILGAIIGQFTDWIIKRLSTEKKVFQKGALKEFKNEFVPNYILIIFTALIYIALVYLNGWSTDILQNLTLFKFMILTPILISTFVIDYKLQIIPNRLNLTLFEVGLIFTFLYGFTNINIATDMCLGLLAGGGVFLIITLVGGLIAGKEAMGFGDVKLMCGLGLIFGLGETIVVTVLSFLIGAILSIILLVSKKKKTSEYIPFGPFIVMASFISMFVPFIDLTNFLMTIFTLGLY